MGQWQESNALQSASLKDQIVVRAINVRLQSVEKLKVDG
jgi:hypothetical protein